MKRLDAVRAVAEALPAGALVVACNGMIGRELFTCRDSPRQFYMIGSMGLASSIGLGLAMARPERTVVVIDGDGNVLMGMGALASVAAAAPRNFLHVVLDNESHASTGGQRTIAGRVALDEIARAAGYAHVVRVADADGFRAGLADLFAAQGPAMLLAKVEPGNSTGVARVDIAPAAMARRFRAAAAGEGS